MRGFAALAAVALAGISPALAQPGAEPRSDAERARLDDPNRVICVNITETGSRLHRNRICRTKAEWDNANAGSQDVVEDWQTRNQYACANPPCQ